MNRFYQLISIAVMSFLLIGCAGTTTYRPVLKKYASRLSNVHAGMTVAQLKAIFPVRRYSESADGKSTYVFRDTVGIYQPFSDKSTKILGVGIEPKAETRRIFFYFSQGRLTHYQ